MTSTLIDRGSLHVISPRTGAIFLARDIYNYRARTLIWSEESTKYAPNRRKKRKKKKHAGGEG
ncbi:hypothetical protein X777_12894 [Ooceraea biroi]|uniref:Uncharacterized protein n=1 Tax=Ooceraea biroi TaxID=2015173 RepID=A0A026VZ46_OOCBI|nr:hypothetical protein X777_12894 [Ooceraea biroi]